jgi:tetratricopeptide (TPR) repeat protein
MMMWNPQMAKLTESALFARVETLLHLEAYDEVIAALGEHRRLTESSFRLAWSLGWSYFQQQQFHSARTALLEAIELAEPYMSAAHWALGLTHEALGELGPAETCLREALEREDTTIARQSLAVVLMQQGSYEKAEEVHKEGLKLQPDSPERWEGYADFLTDAGREAEAARAHTRASALRPTPGSSLN